MTSQEEKVQRFLTGRKSKSSESPGATFQLPPALKMTWYFDTFFEKAIVVLGFFALLWTIIKLIFLRTL